MRLRPQLGPVQVKDVPVCINQVIDERWSSVHSSSGRLYETKLIKQTEKQKQSDFSQMDQSVSDSLNEAKLRLAQTR